MKISKAATVATIIFTVFFSFSITPTANSAESVTIFGSVGEPQATLLRNELSKFGALNGIDIKYVTLNSFDADLAAKVNSGNQPDIAIWWNPVQALKYSSDLIPLENLVDVNKLRETLIPGTDFLPSYKGKTYSLPITAIMKNLIWYNPENFSNSGLQIPKTDTELNALITKIKNEKLGYPWCFNIESGAATGWIPTDWMEENVLRYGGLSNYLEWTFGSLKFNSALVKKAGEKLAENVLTPGNVRGGRSSITTTSFGDTSGLFASDSSKCFMLKQGSFITEFLPDAIRAEYRAGNFKHIGVFKSPTISNGPDVAIGGGEYVGGFNARPATKKVLSYLLSEKFGQGGYLVGNSSLFSPHKTFPTGIFSNRIQRQIAEIIASSDVFGFDASDLRSTTVFQKEWRELTSWMSGNKTMIEAFNEIDTAIEEVAPESPASATYKISKGYLLLSVQIPSALNNSSESVEFVLTSQELGFALKNSISATIVDGRAEFQIPINDSSWGKEISLQVITVQGVELSTPYIKMLTLPKNEVAAPSPKASPTPSRSATPKPSVKTKTPSAPKVKKVKCFKVGITRTFIGTKCPPGYQKR